MASVDLLFSKTPIAGSPVALVFNEDAFEAIITNLAAAATFPPLTFAADLSTALDLTVVAMFPDMTFASLAKYMSNTQRPVVARTIASHQVARHAENGAEHHSREAVRTPGVAVAPWARAAMLDAQLRAPMPRTFVATPNQAAQPFTRASRLAVGAIGFLSTNALHDRRLSRSTRYQEGVDLRNVTSGRWQVMLRDRRPTLLERHQEAIALRRIVTSHAQIARPLQRGWASKAQEAIRPPAGMTLIPTPPPFDPCYLPDANLLFEHFWSGSPNLVFICERHQEEPPPPDAAVVVPVRKVYVVINTVTLRRVANNSMLPALAMSLSIDAESWTWSFQATLPGAELANVEPVAGEPVELEAMINGTPYRVLVEQIARDRSFNASAIRISGRGINAILDAPYVPQTTFRNTIGRTAQQLMHDVLTINGVSNGWDVDFGLDDWFVPPEAWSHQGTYISALTAIAQAAGGYLQPHATAKTIRVLHRYPSAPWEWSTVAPDFELPSAVTVREAIEWRSKPDYSRVYISGAAQGVLGVVTRAGTAGDVIAPMITDPLTTSSLVVRQRGRTVLSDTGRQADVSLRLPVLAETGVITPGKFVRYVDGGTTRLGIVRSTNVDISHPEVFQTIGVETHA